MLKQEIIDLKIRLESYAAEKDENNKIQKFQCLYMKEKSLIRMVISSKNYSMATILSFRYLKEIFVI